MFICKCKWSPLIILFLVCIGSTQAENTLTDDPNVLQDRISQLRQQMEQDNKKYSEEINVLTEQVGLLKKSIESKQSSASAENITNIHDTFPDLNPEISAFGDVFFHAGKNDEDKEQNQFYFRELELALVSPVYPYGHADFFIGIEKEDSDWHTHLEEGYFTFDTLPYDLRSRIGKFYSAFGKANQYHTHAMPWVDKPLMIRNFFCEEGMSKTGAEISWLIPNSWNSYMELIFQAQNNGNEASFAGDSSNNLMYVTHIKNFFDIDNNSSIELSASFATGANATSGGEHRTNLEGLDITYEWRPVEQDSYKSITSMIELMFSQKDQGSEKTVNSHGLYNSLEYQFSRRWSIFGRYDYSQFPDYRSSHENGYSAGMTFRLSEYCFWRLQYEHTESNGDFTGRENRDEIFLQLNFGIGPHHSHHH